MTQVQHDWQNASKSGRDSCVFFIPKQRTSVFSKAPIDGRRSHSPAFPTPGPAGSISTFGGLNQTAADRTPRMNGDLSTGNRCRSAAGFVRPRTSACHIMKLLNSGRAHTVQGLFPESLLTVTSGEPAPHRRCPTTRRPSHQRATRLVGPLLFPYR